MSLEALILQAAARGASDLHLEPGLPPTIRVDGELQALGEPLAGPALHQAAHALLPESDWTQFIERRSHDCSRVIQGVRCRINLLHTTRGVGFAIRLLASFHATIDKLNLHPDLKTLADLSHGLILVSGPTGCGKSTTLAALIQEINLKQARHIVTVESPIEYALAPRRSLIRQREVGRDTPSFEQALLDALREDPDVLMVGEMRDPETMRLTLNASETGHLVFATVHSGSTVEALQRIAASFPAEVQPSVRAMLADCLQAVVCQRLRYRPDLKIRVPECEILRPTHPVKHFIRQGDFFKIMSLLETGADHGMWTFARYQRWLEKRTRWHIPGAPSQEEAEPPVAAPAAANAPRTPPLPVPSPAAGAATTSPAAASPAAPPSIEIEPVPGGLPDLLKKLAK